MLAGNAKKKKKIECLHSGGSATYLQGLYRGVKKLCIDFSNNQKLRYVKYHIYEQCKKLLKHLLKSEFITVKIVKYQLKI